MAGGIPHNRPTIGHEEEQAASRVLQSKWLAQGEEVEQFEEEFCSFLGLAKGHAVATSSGTAALYLALWALNAREQKVGIPTYVCSALRNAVGMIQGKELLLDCQKDSPNMNVQLLHQAQVDIAIVPHLYGIPQNLSQIQIPIIEDCAQSLGALINGVPAGLQGELGVYSFFATKLITSGGQGGMIVSKNKALIDSIKDYRAFDQRTDSQFRFNFQMTDLQAAIGRVQLKKLPQLIQRREKIFQQYKKAGLPLLDAPSPITPVRFRAILLTDRQEEIIKALAQAQIKAVIPIKACELIGSKKDFPHSYHLAKTAVSLPIYPSLTDTEIERVIEVVKGLL